MDTPVLVVSGAASGIGRAVARRWIAEGGRVVGLDRDGRTLASLADETGEEFRGIVADVRSTAEVEAGIATIVDREGRIDAVVTSAGHVTNAASATVADDDFGLLLDVHLHGTLRLARAAYPMLAAQGGAVVTIGSVAARAGLPRRAGYGAAKAGIEGLTRTLAVEWASSGIRVNCVNPGYIDTEFTHQQRRNGAIDTSTITERTPLGRLGEPEEVARAIVFLASSGSSYVTGQSLTVDGGLTISGDWF